MVCPVIPVLVQKMYSKLRFSNPMKMERAVIVRCARHEIFRYQDRRRLEAAVMDNHNLAVGVGRAFGRPPNTDMGTHILGQGFEYRPDASSVRTLKGVNQGVGPSASDDTHVLIDLGLYL